MKTIAALLVLTVVLALAFAIVAATTTRAHAQQSNCTDRSNAISHLSKAYQEQPVAMGLASSGVVEVLTDDQGSSWSIIVTLPSGVTCLVAAGEDWEHFYPNLFDRTWAALGRAWDRLGEPRPIVNPYVPRNT